jgi:hypothetical protein
VPIDAACSPLTIENENVFTRLADALGFRDIEFESEDFNRAFNVKSPDKKFANDVVDARMMQWLLRFGEDTAFEIMGDRVLSYRRKLPPMEIVTLLGISKAFLDHVPRVVYSLYPRATPFPPDPEPGLHTKNEARWLAGHWTPDDPEGGSVTPPEGTG